MNVESYLKHVGTVFVPSGVALFNLWGWLQYVWNRHSIAIVVLVVASIFVAAGIGCLVKAAVLAKKREEREAIKELERYGRAGLGRGDVFPPTL